MMIIISIGSVYTEFDSDLGIHYTIDKRIRRAFQEVLDNFEWNDKEMEGCQFHLTVTSRSNEEKVKLGTCYVDAEHKVFESYVIFPTSFRDLSEPEKTKTYTENLIKFGIKALDGKIRISKEELLSRFETIEA